jgi:hypothetical protein
MLSEAKHLEFLGCGMCNHDWLDLSDNLEQQPNVYERPYKIEELI